MKKGVANGSSNALGILEDLKNFDKKFGGFSRGEFVVLGGRPSMGKTQLLMSLCKNMSEILPTLYLTFDHSVSLITTRFVSCLSNIPIDKILHNDLQQEDKLLLEYHEKYSSKYKLFKVGWEMK